MPSQSAAERMAGILALHGRLPRSLVENAAIAMGRLSMVAPSVVAPHLPHFFMHWCQVGRLPHFFVHCCQVGRLLRTPAVGVGRMLRCAVRSASRRPPLHLEPSGCMLSCAVWSAS